MKRLVKMIVREAAGGERVWLNNDYRHINVRLYSDYKPGINTFCLSVITCTSTHFVFGNPRLLLPRPNSLNQWPPWQFNVFLCPLLSLRSQNRQFTWIFYTILIQCMLQTGSSFNCQKMGYTHVLIISIYEKLRLGKLGV